MNKIILFIAILVFVSFFTPVTSFADDSALVNNQGQLEMLTEKEAEKVVRDQFDIDDSTYVEFDHEQEGSYVVHVYDFIEIAENIGHTATQNWYVVNPSTKEVTSLFEW